MNKRILKQAVERIMDANFNRAKEGLRVCEDICRFAWDWKQETKMLKEMRHQLSLAIKPAGFQDLIAARDIGGDVGKISTESEFHRKNLDDVFYANAQRVKESLRVLEEIMKLYEPKAALEIKNLRYRFYAIERKMALRS